MKPSFSLRMLEKVELFLYRRAAAIVALTQSFKDDLINRGINADKIAVVINGVDLPRYSPKPKDAALLAQYHLQNKFVIGYLGTHGMAHGLENILLAANSLQDHKQIIILFVGDGAEREQLIATAAKMRLNNVIFIPAQAKADIPNFWSICDVALVHLKNSEVFTTVIPSKIFEAMAMGLPIILAAPTGEASDIIVNERVGIWVEAAQPQALANAIVTLANDKALCATYAQMSIKMAPQHSREYQARAMLNVLENVNRRCKGKL